MKTGIYKIRNLKNNKLYIGSAAGKGFCNRWNLHRKQLENDCHHSVKLQRAWNKYSADAFIFEIIEECEPELCLEREQHYFDTILFASCNDKRFNQLGYNICRVAGNTRGQQVWLGKKRSKETCRKMSIAMSGENNPMYGVRGKDHPSYGKPRSDETRQKIREACLGKGFPHSEETKEKIRIGKRGEKSGTAKLIEHDIRVIKRALSFGILQKKIAVRFGISRQQVSKIKHGLRWSHV